MTQSEIFTAAHGKVKMNYTKKSYREKFSQALKMIYKTIKANKAYKAAQAVASALKAEFEANKEGSFRVTIKKSPELVVFIESWNGISIQLVDEKGNASWNCGTRTGSFKPNDIVKYSK